MLFARGSAMTLFIGGLVSACASAVVPSGTLTKPASVNTLTARDWSESGSRGSLMDALERLRPGWLTARGATSAVSVDGGPPGELSLLRSISLSDVREVRFEQAASSVGHSRITASGAVIVGNVILVMTSAARQP